MHASSMTASGPVRYELRFAHLFQAGRGYAFPCDAEGRVDLDGLSEAGRANYFYARALVGRDLACPRTRAVAGAPG